MTTFGSRVLVPQILEIVEHNLGLMGTRDDLTSGPESRPRPPKLINRCSINRQRYEASVILCILD